MSRPTKLQFIRLLNLSNPGRANYGEKLYSSYRIRFNQLYPQWLKDFVDKRSLTNTKL
jgi:hypothetical protein